MNRFGALRLRRTETAGNATKGWRMNGHDPRDETRWPGREPAPTTLVTTLISITPAT
jgi:hypothetical protein